MIKNQQHHCPRCLLATALAWLGDRCLTWSDRLVPFSTRGV